jgi:predicted permease
MKLPAGIRRLFRLPPSEARRRRDLDDEVQFHLEMRAAALRERGLSAAEAEADARRVFGDIADLRAHSALAGGRRPWRVWAGEWLGEWWRIIAFAGRRLRSSPAFTIGVTLTLAIAIGGTASVFAVVNGVLLKAFPYREPERVLTVWESHPDPDQRKMRLSPLDFIDFRAQAHSFSAFAGEASGGQATVTGTGEPERVYAAAISPNYLSALGLTLAEGRTFASDTTGPDEVLISYGYWQRHFGGARSVVGQKLTIDGSPFVVVGIMPAGLPQHVDIWVRLSLPPGALIHRDYHSLYAYGRLAAGATPEAASREVETIAQRLAAAYPQTNANWSAFTIPLVDQLVGPVRPALVMVLAAAGCVLLIGASNLANLFLVRLFSREREIAVRIALGATRGRLVRELLAEAGILGVLAGAIGVGAAIVGTRVLRGLAPSTLPRLDQVGVDGRVVAFCAVSSIATVVIFGVLPAWYTSRGSLADVLKAGGRTSASAQHRRMQSSLVILQVVVALVLLTGAGLLAESFERFRLADAGFRAEGVLTARVSLPDERYPTPERATAYADEAVRQLGALPGVTSAAITSLLPNGGGVASQLRFPFNVVGDPVPDPTEEPDARPAYVTPDFLRTMGIALKRGRALLPSDDRRGRNVVVVDERFVREYFGSRDPIGRQLMIIGPDSGMVEIVGVVSQVKQGGLIADDIPWIYFPLAQAPTTFDFGQGMTVVVRTAGDPEAVTAGVRRVMRGIDGSVPFYDVRTMEARVAESVGTPRFSTFLASLFAVVALVLGAIGIYSVMMYAVSQREREIGVRLALGASRGRVMRDVLWRALSLAGIGIGAGAIVAWAVTRALASLFVGVSPHDPIIFVGAAGAFAVVALVAASVPAVRTTRVNPVVALSAN